MKARDSPCCCTEAEVVDRKETRRLTQTRDHTWQD